MDRQIIDELLNKARSYPKVEGYLRGLDKRRIDEGEDVPVTKREKAVRQADENAAKRLESQGKSMEKCHTHVLDGETEDSLKAKKKQAPKAKDHVFGNDPNDKRGSEYEMVEVKEPQAYKSLSSGFEPSDLVKSINALLEKATYHGVGSRAGKISVQGTHKNPKAHGKVSSPSLSEERKKEIIEGGRKKALTQAEMGGLHAQAAKIRAEKSLDERTADLVKALNVDYGPRKSGVKRGGYRQDPDYDLHPKDREKSDSSSDTRGPLPSDADSSKKSLDDRTCDLAKDMAKDLTKEREREIHSAVMAARMIKEDAPGVEKMDYKPDDLARVARTHNNIAAKRTLKSVCDKWISDSPYITKGSMILPLGPGGEIQDLSKDEKRPAGSRTPTYQQTDEKQREVETGKIYRENKAKKRIEALKEEQDFGAE